MLAGRMSLPCSLLAAIPLSAMALVTHAHAADYTVTDQAQFNAAVAAATQPGRNDTINVDAANVFSPAIMIPAAASSIVINFNGQSGGPAVYNPTFDVGFGVLGQTLGVGPGTTLNFNTNNGIASLRVGFANGAAAGTGTVNMTGGTINGIFTGINNYFTLNVGRGSPGSQGTFNQSGGSIFINGGAFNLGVADATGTYTMSGDAKLDMGPGTICIGCVDGNGTLTVGGNAQFLVNDGNPPLGNGQIYIGSDGGTGLVIQNGAGSRVVLNAQNGTHLGLGGGTGEYRISAGQLLFGGVGSGNAGLNLGDSLNGTGTFTQTGGQVTLNTGQIRFGTAGVGTGTYNLNGGTLQIGVANPFAANTANYEFNLGGGTIQALTGFSTGLAFSLTGGTSTIDTNGFNAAFSGVLDGAGALSKVGAGALTLSGNNTYSGGTQLNAGTIIAGSNTALGTGLLSFNAASTLQFGGNFTLANAMTIGPGVIASVNTNGNTATAINGVIAGDGALAKVGAGALTLNGANTYTGGTRVAAGTLELGASNRLASSGALQVDAGALFNLLGNQQTVGAFSGAGGVLLGGASGALTTNSDSTTVFSGSILGGGSFTKGGGGTLFLTGDSDYTGPTTVNGGTLVVNGSLDSVVTVFGGTLGGDGTIGGLIVESGGTASPDNFAGTPIGTLDVAGPVTFELGSTYQVEVGPAGQTDLIDATGLATINGGTVAITALGPVSLGTRYTILTAAGGRNGEFDGASGDFAFLTPTLGYDPTDVFLTFARNGVDLVDAAQTRNQRAVAGALDQFPSDNPLFEAVISSSEAGARQAFDALSGEVHASAAGVLVMDSFYVRDAIFSRLIQASYAGAAGAPTALGATGPTTVAAFDPGTRMSLGAGFDDIGEARAGPAFGHGLAFWTRGFGAWGDLDGNGNAASLDRTLGGFVSGVDAGLGGGWRAGLATGYMRSDIGIGARQSSADIDSYILAGYAGGAAGPFAVRSGGAWTWNSLDTTRNVVFPGFFENERASYNAGTGQLFAELAYPLLYASSALEPFAGLSYVHVGSDGFTESGPEAGLVSGGADQNVGISLLGLRAGTSFPVHGLTVTPHGSLAWQYAFGDVTPAQAFAFASTGIGFGIAGVPIARSSALIQAGVDLNLDEEMALGLTYTGQLAEDFNDNSVQGRFNWRF